jgi:hypothetical protein
VGEADINETPTPLRHLWRCQEELEARVRERDAARAEVEDLTRDLIAENAVSAKWMLDADALAEAATEVVKQVGGRYDDQWAVGSVLLADLDRLRDALDAHNAQRRADFKRSELERVADLQEAALERSSETRTPASLPPIDGRDPEGDEEAGDGVR